MNSMAKMTRRWGQPVAMKLAQRLQQLEAVDRLDLMRRLPGRCHELTADRRGELAVEVTGSMRLVFVPDHDPLPTKPDGGLDWAGVEAIVVTEIVDYH